eukprot:TRINITY_DN8325_c0_g5_i2.p1 TRINITY_DN8325_c0_g5~~TRINITY_DN8325_c0_g5_i2.p1  ORF type:complete len:557 (-),score=147.83 TRINITY_DN8325_c0_g5_i2:52-1722(-)
MALLFSLNLACCLLQRFGLVLLLTKISFSAASASIGTSPIEAVPPEGAVAWDLPYPFLGVTVSGLSVMMNASLVREYDGADKNNIVVDIKGQGPLPWSLARWNRGDFAPRLAPRHPYAQPNLGIPGGANGFRTEDPKSFPAQAWRPTVNRGVVLASVAQNGQEWDDGTSRFYGTVAANTDSHGFGYSMDNGFFTNSNPNINIAVGKVGPMGEANIDVSVAWFPYDQGWIGGYVDAPAAAEGEEKKWTPGHWLTADSHSPLLPDDARKIVHWGKRGGSLSLPNVMPSSDGMLFTTSTDPGPHGNDLNVVSLYTKRSGKGWRVQQREDSEDDVKKMAVKSELMFAFVYIPFTAGGLIGGIIDGPSGATVNGKGPYICQKVGVGQYEINITVGSFRQRGFVTARDGMLLLQVMGRDDIHRKYARHAFLSYNFTGRGSLVVESRKLVTDDAGDQDCPLTDADFAFVWIDFNHPLTPTWDTYTGPIFGAPHSWGAGFGSGFAAGGVLLLLLLLLVLAATVCLLVLRWWGSYSSSRGHERHRPPPVEMGTSLLDSTDYELAH